MRQADNPPQEIVDEHTLIAQRYAGYLVGHPYQAAQQGYKITVDSEEWIEPNVISDTCVFCSRLTDAEAIRRVAGYQWQLDIEATRNKGHHYTAWVQSDDPRIPDPSHHVWSHHQDNLRAFVELFQDVPTANHPNGWKTRPLPMIDLPLRLKRKLCIEWNHLLLGWMTSESLSYDYNTHVFWHEVPDVEPYCCPECESGAGLHLMHVVGAED